MKRRIKRVEKKKKKEMESALTECALFINLKQEFL